MSDYNYERCGRRLVVEFVCERCGQTEHELASKQHLLERLAVGAYMPPQGWIEDHNRNGLLCPDCATKLKRFLDGKGDVVCSTK